MKRKIPLKLFHLFFVFVGLSLLGGSPQFSVAQNQLQPSDMELSFPIDLKTSSVIFKLKSIGERKFKIVLEKSALVPTKVKVYDVVGNLIREDLIKPEDGAQKSFDFSHINSKLFVVEVGNSKYNRTKSIYAQPQGTPKAITAPSVLEKEF